MTQRLMRGLGVAVLGFLALAPGALAQQKPRLIGYLDPSATPPTQQPSRNLEAFEQGLGELGYREGRDYIIDARYADADLSRLPALAQQLVDDHVDIIVTIGTPTVRAATAATTKIPIVMAGSHDPIYNGFIASFPHPGANVTGVTLTPGGIALDAKGLQLLKQVAPHISYVGCLYSDDTGLARPATEFISAAAGLGLRASDYEVSPVKSADDFGAILSQLAKDQVDAVFVYPTFVSGAYRKQLIDFLQAKRLPSMFQDWTAVRAGGLMSYYTDFLDLRRRAAYYVDKIFRGAAPADLPVEQPTKFSLTLNLATAKLLDLKIPPDILADQTFE